MLTIKNLSCMRGGYTVFPPITLSIPDGTILLAKGHNGSGKSSLLRILAGLVRPHEGDISFRDHKWGYMDKSWNNNLLYVGHSDGHKPHLSCEENLLFWAAIYGCRSDMVYCALDECGLTAHMKVPVSCCSAGQKRRLALARLMVAERPLWLLDEPFSSIDHEMAGILSERISGFCKQKGTVVIAEHKTDNIPCDIQVQTIRLVSRNMGNTCTNYNGGNNNYLHSSK